MPHLAKDKAQPSSADAPQRSAVPVATEAPRVPAKLGDTCPTTELGRGALGHGVSYRSDKGTRK